MTDGGRATVSDGFVPEDLLLAFLNTIDIEDETDTITTKAELARWGAFYDLGAGDLAEARSVRDALRAIAGGDPGTLPVIDVPIRQSGSLLVPAPRTVAEAAAAAAMTLALQGRLGRVRLCQAHECRFAFYDHSRNGSRTWCQMGICGNRAKARSYRERNA